MRMMMSEKSWFKILMCLDLPNNLLMEGAVQRCTERENLVAGACASTWLAFRT